MTEEPQGPAPPSAWRFMWGGGIAALLATIGNLWWFGKFAQLTGLQHPGIVTPEAIVTATMASVLLDAGIYLLLARALRIATPLYVIGTLAVAGATVVAPLVPVMPDGTATPETLPALAIPMHLWAGLCAAVVVPIVVHVGRRRRAGG